MPHNRIVTAILLSGFLSLPLLAQEDVVGKPAAKFNTRQGFFIGGDLGLGGINVESSTEPGAALGLKIGAGLNEELLLFAEAFSVISTQNANTPVESKFAVSGLYVSAQYFFLHNFYALAGAGFARSTYEVASFSASTSVAPSLHVGLGHEFRTSDIVSLSPEIKYAFTNIEGIKFHWFAAVLDIKFYFD